MIKNTLAGLPAATLLTLALAACGGGSEDRVNATTPAKFRSTDDVAGLVSAFNGTAGAFGIALSETEDKAASTATAKRGGVLRSKRGGVGAKATTIEACDSGSIAFTDDTSTVYTDDGLSVASSCRYNESGSSTTLNGKINDKCVDSGQTASNCNASSIRIADGASGASTFDVTATASNVDLAVKLKGDLLESTSGDTENISLNAVVAFNDNVSRISGDALFENFSNAYTYDSSTGNGRESLNGNFGVSSSRSQCALGKVNIKTENLIVTNSNDEPIGGLLTLTDGNGQQARVQFNSDGSTTIALSNGQTRTYGAAQLASLCQ